VNDEGSPNSKERLPSDDAILKPRQELLKIGM